MLGLSGRRSGLWAKGLKGQPEMQRHRLWSWSLMHGRSRLTTSCFAVGKSREERKGSWSQVSVMLRISRDDVANKFLSWWCCQLQGGAWEEALLPSISVLPARFTDKRNEQYSHVMASIRARLSFSLLHSCIMYIRGCREAPFDIGFGVPAT